MRAAGCGAGAHGAGGAGTRRGAGSLGTPGVGAAIGSNPCEEPLSLEVLPPGIAPAVLSSSGTWTGEVCLRGLIPLLSRVVACGQLGPAGC